MEPFSNTKPEGSNTISITEEKEIKYWLERFGCSEEELRRAIDAFGNNAEEIGQVFGK